MDRRGTLHFWQVDLPMAFGHNELRRHNNLSQNIRYMLPISQLPDRGSARFMIDEVPDCVNGLAVFISRQCANLLSVPIQATSYNKLSVPEQHEQRNTTIRRHNISRKCTHCKVIHIGGPLHCPVNKMRMRPITLTTSSTQFDSYSCSTCDLSATSPTSSNTTQPAPFKDSPALSSYSSLGTLSPNFIQTSPPFSKLQHTSISYPPLYLLTSRKAICL